MKFRFGTEQRLSATDACVGSGRFRVFVFAGEGGLSALLPGHKVLILRKLFAPIGVIFLNSVRQKYPLSRPEGGSNRPVSDTAHPVDVTF